MADDKDEGAGSPRFSTPRTPETHFSWLRTRMSVERTLMSSVRTATALIAFGFTIFQFLRQVNAMPGANPARFPEAGWYLGLTLIAAGVIGLLVAIWEYRWMIRYLWGSQFQVVAGVDELPWHTPTLAIAIVLILAGIFAFSSVFFRL